MAVPALDHETIQEAESLARSNQHLSARIAEYAPGRGSQYSAQDRVRAAAHFALVGVMSRVSQATGIPEVTLSDWRRSDWFDDVLTEIRSESEDQFRANFRRLALSAQETVMDRLNNGERKLMKTKKIKHECGSEDYEYTEMRQAVSARDASLVGAIAYDKLRISNNLPTSITGQSSSKMIELAAKFAQLSNQVNAKTVSTVEARQDTDKTALDHKP